MTDQLSEATQKWQQCGRLVDAGGMQVFAYEKGSGPAILFLHGFPTSSYDWREIIDILSADYRCVAFDFPGFGLSDKPSAYSYSLFQQADTAEAVADGFGLAEAHVVSHDMGTSVQTELLARELEGRLGFRILSATFLNGSMLQGLATITMFQKLLSANETLPQGIAVCENVGANYVEGLKAIMKRPEVVGEEDAQVMNELLLYGEGNRRLPAIAGYMRERYVHKDRWIGALQKTSIATQFVWAEGDPIANIELGRALHAEVPNARYTELPELGHFLLMEDPEAVASEIRNFVAING
jgi:pimeloyl-ACP methyl ester carboxylesterase